MDAALQGPWKTISGPAGSRVPFYVVPFDKNGTCTAPRTRAHLLGAVADATDVLLVSHGWNNHWVAATERYDRFVTSFSRARRTHWDPPDREYRPVVVGIFWPSTALVAPGERAPDIAGGPRERTDEDPLGELDAVADAVAAALGSSPPERFYDLVTRDALTRTEARELADLVAPGLAGTDDDLGREAEQPDTEDLLDAWARSPREEPGASTVAVDPGGFVPDEPAATSGGPSTAGLLDALDPRNLVRVATVLLMKDRAGRVGARGVAALLRDLTEASPHGRLRLVGHSYGAKVVLSALCAGAAPARPVESVLLLQPAMSALCFSSDADGAGRAGGYRSALVRTRQPVMTTYSRHDVPLTKLFHLAVRRRSDLGEAVIAGGPPSRFAALGGFGPQGADDDVRRVTACAPPARYDLSAGRRIVAVRSDDVISSHGGVENDATAWMLLDQMRS